ncbi:MAG TPA: hypothetical protein VJK00_04545, partial [Steroidobacteraceae bacterium]|nr:hypothetical protein [Steroidobacteraceae bacterium]
RSFMTTGKSRRTLELRPAAVVVLDLLSRQKKARNLLDLLARLRKMPALAGDMPTTRSQPGRADTQDEPSWMTWTGS